MIKPPKPKKPKVGTIREDGYIFLGYRWNKSYKRYYPVYSSPMALAKDRQRQAKWRQENRDKARASFLAWKERGRKPKSKSNSKQRTKKSC